VSAYHEFAPSRDLHPLVACRWMRVVPEGSPSSSTLILPDGCMDLLWRDGEVVLAGPDRMARPTQVSPGQVIRGVRLRPGVAGALIGMPASEVLDGHFPLQDVLGTTGLELRERLGESGDDAAFELLEGLVSSRLRERAPDPLVLAAAPARPSRQSSGAARGRARYQRSPAQAPLPPVRRIRAEDPRQDPAVPAIGLTVARDQERGWRSRAARRRSRLCGPGAHDPGLRRPLGPHPRAAGRHLGDLRPSSRRV
jgi:hypothetical protein